MQPVLPMFCDFCGPTTRPTLKQTYELWWYLVFPTRKDIMHSFADEPKTGYLLVDLSIWQLIFVFELIFMSFLSHLFTKMSSFLWGKEEFNGIKKNRESSFMSRKTVSSFVNFTHILVYCGGDYVSKTLLKCSKCCIMENVNYHQPLWGKSLGILMLRGFTFRIGSKCVDALFFVSHCMNLPLFFYYFRRASISLT